MRNELLENVERYSAAHADQNGITQLPIAGMSLVRAYQPSVINFAIYKPLVALVLQGSKSVSVGSDSHHFSAGESLIVTADMPTISQVTYATGVKPYYAFIMELDLPLLRELSVETAALEPNSVAVRIEQTDVDVAATAGRVMQLAHRPEAMSILGQNLKREMHFWLINGRHKQAISSVTAPDSQFQRITEVMSHIRSSYTQPLQISMLAERAGMSLTSFHQHFRTVTKLTPLQYQKQLRLIEARRKMMQEGLRISAVAFDVGYESVPQFTREYARFFGAPPARDTRSQISSGSAEQMQASRRAAI